MLSIADTTQISVDYLKFWGKILFLKKIISFKYATTRTTYFFTIKHSDLFESLLIPFNFVYM